MSLDTFSDATNGYLVDDSCLFGIQVSAVKHTGNGETLKMNIRNPKQVTFNWKICKFSKRRRRTPHVVKIISQEFTVGNHKWRLWLYPNGDSGVKDSLSLYLELVLAPSTVKKVIAEYSLEIQNQISKSHHQKRASVWFNTTKSNVTTSNWGWPKFILLSDLENESSGFRQKDTVLIQAKVNIKTEVTYFS
ncbi:hypothetical protein POM88_028796 [Heracleum sosnowskyi]|uniref:MATH domain-containing protein n=1 Tax=Heracleum sosnowskyi TaxID=360622 RepID=A0AAD8MHX9_9APIA|nr:hypothetical protein POM88_028796 [Heracleum sosnowskyi]